MVNTIPSSSNTISLSDGSNKDITHLSKEELIALLKNPQVAKHDKPKIQAKLQLLSTLKSKAITIDRSYLDQIDHEYFLKEKANIINMLNSLPLSEETYFCTALKKIFDTPKDQYSAYQ